MKGPEESKLQKMSKKDLTLQYIILQLGNKSPLARLKTTDVFASKTQAELEHSIRTESMRRLGNITMLLALTSLYTYIHHLHTESRMSRCLQVASPRTRYVRLSVICNFRHLL